MQFLPGTNRGTRTSPNSWTSRSTNQPVGTVPPMPQQAPNKARLMAALADLEREMLAGVDPTAEGYATLAEFSAPAEYVIPTPLSGVTPSTTTPSWDDYGMSY